MKTQKLGRTDVTTQVVGRARKEKNAQKRLDKMQIDVLEGDAGLGKREEAAKKEIETITKNRGKLAELDVKNVSDFTELQRMAETEFKSVTKESLATEEAEKAEKFIAGIIAPTQEQKAVAFAWHGLRARKNYEVVAQVRAILSIFHKTVEKAKVAKEELQPAEAN